MSTLTIASSAADAAAAEKAEQHHAEMAGRLDMLTAALVTAATTGDGEAERRDLLDWLQTELVPHAKAEEETLYPAAADLPEMRALVEAMLVEHQLLHRLVAELVAAPDMIRAAATAKALETLFDSLMAKENDQLIPALVASPRHAVAELLEGMHELLGSEEDAGHSGDHECGCGEVDPAGYPELDARVIPHAIRHATIFGALDAVRPGAGLVLVAPHDPLPLLAQIEERAPGVFEVRYLERGPEAWRMELVRGA